MIKEKESNTWYCNTCEHYHFIGESCPKVRTVKELFPQVNWNNWEKEEDVVNSPSHYRIPGLEVEALEVIRGVLTREEYIGYLRGNILKYQIRANKKGGEEDLQKSIAYSTELEIFLRDSS